MLIYIDGFWIDLGNPQLQFKFIVVDDNSTDGTAKAILALGYDCEVIHGTGSLFWCGGMRLGIDRYFEIADESPCLLINDDVDFYDGSIEKLFSQMDGQSVIVGATCDSNKKFTYGLRIRKELRTIELGYVEPNKEKIIGDTMNANCVLIPYAVFKDIGNMEKIYRHSLGDYDLGFKIRRKGYELISSYEYVGICETNSFKGTWRDATMSRLERLKKNI